MVSMVRTYVPEHPHPAQVRNPQHAGDPAYVLVDVDVDEDDDVVFAYVAKPRRSMRDLRDMWDEEDEASFADRFRNEKDRIFDRVMNACRDLRGRACFEASIRVLESELRADMPAPVKAFVESFLASDRERLRSLA